MSNTKCTCQCQCGIKETCHGLVAIFCDRSKSDASFFGMICRLKVLELYQYEPGLYDGMREEFVIVAAKDDYFIVTYRFGGGSTHYKVKRSEVIFDK